MSATVTGGSSVSLLFQELDNPRNDDAHHEHEHSGDNEEDNRRIARRLYDALTDRVFPFHVFDEMSKRFGQLAAFFSRSD